jgi:hypothetical protein
VNILPRLISISVKKYETRPDERDPAVTMLLRNALLLAVAHFGVEKTQALLRQTLQGPQA